MLSLTSNFAPHYHRTMTKKDKLLLLVPAGWASLFDIAITIVHQPQEYWDGDLSKKNEGNPIGTLLMENHVAGLFILSACWLILIALLGYHLPQKISKVFLLFCLMAHSYGASTWLYNLYGFWYVMAFTLFNAMLYNIIDNRVQSKKASQENVRAN